MKSYYTIIILFFLLGCSGSPDKTVIPEEQMTKVLWDMIQVDELATLRLTKDTTKNAKKERIQLYQKVFQLHKVSEKQFSSSIKYYSGHPDLMKVLFDTLEARGARERKLGYTHRDSLIKK